MYIAEIFNEIPSGYRSEKEDNSVLKLSDLRKTPLTLGQINKLRMMNTVRKFEHEKKLDKISTQYSPPAEESAPAL